jgi:hypothetical protein
MPDALQQEVLRLVSEAAAERQTLDIGEALKRLAALDQRARQARRELVDALIAASLRAGVHAQLPII